MCCRYCSTAIVGLSPGLSYQSILQFSSEGAVLEAGEEFIQFG
jgi:hypothetical protein